MEWSADELPALKSKTSSANSNLGPRSEASGKTIFLPRLGPRSEASGKTIFLPRLGPRVEARNESRNPPCGGREVLVGGILDFETCLQNKLWNIRECFA
ncbi:hypothetical protein AVEN_38913-1 [Araneus ventricosus]|uniref:Uncharacterized protein n=1 Tax=Araneus ventricosus TaxID=182803 RepID=A0A4Y2U6J9_ARAVE|nr:hypothetical protein AVEN_31537-1 [Araneus ventricosus]GBO07251.1 hypothetical protein AVEN_66171-1 [Araneus ventricosus]GBO07277.1 hypothetical protein AVEN_38913-1 [Araneus ventricosus]